MTQENKQLLLKDLCARLPYGVKMWFPSVIAPIVLDEFVLSVARRRDEEFKPYLRPMSSMTEGEILEFIRIGDSILRIGEKKLICILSLKQMDWLNAHHFDYRIDPSTGKTLIESNLAIEAPKDMYKNE